MPNPDVPLAGEVVEDEWGAAVVSRLVPVYLDEPARDTAIPAPENGQLAYADDGLKVRHKGVWSDVIVNDEDLTSGWRIHYHANAFTLWHGVEPRLSMFAGGGVNLHGDDPNNAKLRVLPTGGIEIQTVAAGEPLIALGGDGPTAGSGRRFQLRRAASFGILELVTFQTDNREHIAMEFLDSGIIRLPEVTAGGTGSGTAIGVTGSGNITKLSSSARYKRDIADWVPPSTVTDIGLKSFRLDGDIEAAEDDTNPLIVAPTRVGVVAEDVDAAGLSGLVTYDLEGRPESVDTATLALAQLAALEARVAALEGATP